MSLLDVQKLTVRFGGLTAVSEVDLALEPGKIFSIIGPNGAGKTTVFNALTGIYEPTARRVAFEGRDPRRPFTLATALNFIYVGLLTGLGFVIARNLTSLWEATVTANFVYQKPFPYAKAWGDLAAYLRALPPSRSMLPLSLGLFLGLAGSVVVWLRSRGAPNCIAESGIARTFQNIRLFSAMTVLENVLVGMEGRLKTRVWDMIFRTPLYWRERRQSEQSARELLRFVGLEGDLDGLACNLPYGHQRRLEIARALASRPKLLLLDEPAAGMNPTETRELMDLIRKIRDSGVAVLLIEHHMRVVMGVSDRIAVLDYGNKIAEGRPEEIRNDPKVIEAYLGKETAE